MKQVAIEFTERGKADIVPLGPPPEPTASQVLIETLFTGVTHGTERHALLVEHGYGGGAFPSRHGYQHVGRVVKVGPEVRSLHVGDVIFCGDYVGHRGWHITDENGLVMVLPDSVDSALWALSGVAAVALRAVRRMRVGVGDRVWVAGQGPIGHFLGQCARAVGAYVTVTDVVERRLEAAREGGAHVVLHAEASDAWNVLEHGGPYDFIFDACSAPRLLFDVYDRKLLAYGGCVGMMAVRGETAYPWSLLHGTEARIETSCHFSRDDLRVLRFLVQEGLVRLGPVLSDLVPIENAPQLYNRLAEGDPSLLGVVFEWC